MSKLNHFVLISRVIGTWVHFHVLNRTKTCTKSSSEEELDLPNTLFYFLP